MLTLDGNVFSSFNHAELIFYVVISLSCSTVELETGKAVCCAGTLTANGIEGNAFFVVKFNALVDFR